MFGIEFLMKKMWCVFLAASSLNWIYFPIFVHYYFSKMGIFRAPWFHSRKGKGRGKTYACVDFFVWNSISNYFYLKLFLMQCVFLAASSPKLNLLSHFCTILYFKKWESFEPHSSTEEGEGVKIDICAHGLFHTKFNARQLLF